MGLEARERSWRFGNCPRRRGPRRYPRTFAMRTSGSGGTAGGHGGSPGAGSSQRNPGQRPPGLWRRPRIWAGSFGRGSCIDLIKRPRVCYGKTNSCHCAGRHAQGPGNYPHLPGPGLRTGPAAQAGSPVPSGAIPPPSYMAIVQGRPAVTDFLLRYFQRHSPVRQLADRRTHQIRVHFSHPKRPVGIRYGPRIRK